MLEITFIILLASVPNTNVTRSKFFPTKAKTIGTQTAMVNLLPKRLIKIKTKNRRKNTKFIILHDTI